MVIDGQDLLWLSGIKTLSRFINYQVNHIPCRLMIKIFPDQFGTAARIDEVVKTGAGDLHIAQDIENSRNFPRIAFVDCKTQANFQPFGLTIFNAFQGFCERAFLAPETVMGFFQTVQRNAHV